MRKILKVASSTTVCFESMEKLEGLLGKKQSRYALITDTHLEKLIGKVLEETLIQKGFDVSLISIPAGEQHKTRATKELIEDRMLAQKFGRDSCILALGGGIVTDIAGFAASTYCRGIPFVALPTSLLGMVDASIGGKAGVNTPQGKNLVGAFYPAELVVIDHKCLDSLPQKEWKNGFAEVIKYGLIASIPLFSLMEKDAPMNTSEIIYRSICIKKKIIEKDPKENGLRRILNFGHTVGHALETLFGYEISHGEAVAVGMMIESYASMKLGTLSKNELDRILAVMQKYGFSTHFLRQVDFQDLLDAMAMDKKALTGNPRFVVLNSIGNTHSYNGNYCTAIDSKILREAYEYFSH